MKRKMMPATGGAIPYGHSSSVRYTERPRIFCVASAAITSAPATAIAVTLPAKTKELTTLR